jgi:hypothetical protein
VSKTENEFAEGTIRNLYDYHTLFMAQAWILNVPYKQLAKFIDIPAVERGDLSFIDNLVAALESESQETAITPPVIEPNGGSFNQPVQVHMLSTTENARIFYTLDGTYPTKDSSLYTQPITLYTSTSIRAQSYLNDHSASLVITSNFDLLHTFKDVPYNHWAHDPIETLFQSGFVSGCATDPPLYCPERILNRAESSVFTLRGVYGAIEDPPYPNPNSPTFSDVQPAFWGYGWIESLWQDGFTAGCNSDPLLYCPEDFHTRAEGSVFFLRIKHGPDYEPAPHQGLFSDVPSNAWYARWVEAAYNEGILPACQTDPLHFCPHDLLDRAWAAYMMVQAKGNLN